MMWRKCCVGTFSRYALSISPVVIPDVSGIKNQVPKINKTLIPAKMKPVLAPRFPESTLYIYGTTNWPNQAMNACEVIPIDIVFARSLRLESSAAMGNPIPWIRLVCKAIRTFLRKVRNFTSEGAGRRTHISTAIPHNAPPPDE